MKTHLFSFCLLFILFIQSNIIAGINQPDTISSTQLIRESFQQEQISNSEQIKYLGYSLVAPSRLPLEYRSNIIEKCGSWIQDLILEKWNTLTPETKEDLMRVGFNNFGVMSRPGFLDETSETDHFMIHYSIDIDDTNAVDITDNNSNGIPDYIDMVRDIAEHVWRKEIDTMQYTAPPSDGGILENDKFDLYIYKVGKYYGVTWREQSVGDNPNSVGTTENNAWTGYIALRNNYSGFSGNDEEALKVTMAHEFMHAIENGYDALEKVWLKEVTSTWVEDEVYDAVNDNYQYLASWFAIPQYSLDDIDTNISNHWYGSWIFARYLSEHFGQNIIRTIWDKSVINNSATMDFSTVALESALIDNGTTFPAQFTNFAIANLVQSVPPYDYEEHASYPEVRISDLILSNYQYNPKVRKRGTRYYRISRNLGTYGTDQLKLIFSEVSTTDDFSATLITRQGSVFNFHKFYPGSNNFTLNNTASYDDLYLVVSNNTTSEYSDTWFSGKVQQYRLTDAEILDEGNITNLMIGEKTVGWTTSWDTLHVFSDGSYRKNIEVIDYSPARNSNQLIWTTNHVNSEILYAYSTGGVYQLSRTEFDTTPTNVPKFSTTLFNVLPQIDSDYGWASGYLHSTSEAGLFRIKVQDTTTFEKISDQILDDLDQLIVDGTNAAWNYVDNDASNEQINYYNGTVKNIKTYNFSDFYGITGFDFDADRIAWLEWGTDNQGTIFQRLKFYTISTSTESIADSVSYSFMFPETGREIKYFRTYGNKLVWSVTDYDKDSLFIYLKNINRELLFSEKDSSISNESYFDIRMDDKGVAWIEELNVPWGTRTFNYLDFGTNNRYRKNIDLGVPHSFFKDWDISESDFYILAENQNNLRTKLIKLNIKSIPTNLELESLIEEKDFLLSQNYPNPFNPATTINYGLPFESKVKLEVYNILGQRVGVLVNKVQKPGNYKIEFNGNGLASGLYFYRIQAGTFTNVKKMILIK